MNWTAMGVLLTVFIQTLIGVWWASSMNTKMNFMTQAIKQIMTHDGGFQTKHDAEAHVVKRDAEIAKINLEIERIRDEFQKYQLTHKNCEPIK